MRPFSTAVFHDSLHALDRTIAVLLVLVGAALLGQPSLAADRIFPGGPLNCEATLQSSGGQDSSTDLATNSIFALADGDSSNGQVGFAFRPFISHPATIRMGVTYSGLGRRE